MQNNIPSGKNGIKEKAVHIIVAIYALVLSALNFLRIFDNVFWGDEAYSIGLARMDFIPMIRETASDVHPPLYYLLLTLLVRIFGERGWVYHLSGLIPFLAVVIFICTVFYKRFGPAASLVFLTLMGLSDNAAVYNVEVRMYSLAFMFVLFSFYSFLLLLKKEKKAALFFVLFSLGAAYTHYYALLAVSFFYMVLFFRMLVKKEGLKEFLVISGATVAGYLPWVLKLMMTFGRTTGDYWMEEIPGFKDIIKFYYSSGNKWYSYVMFVITIIVLLLCLLKERNEENAWMMTGFLSCFGTAGIGVLVSLALRPVFTFRFLYPTVSLMWMILAVSLGRIRYGYIAALILTAVSCLIFVPSFKYTYSYEKMIDADCSETLALIGPMIGKEDMIITNGEHLNWTLLDYYLPGVSHEYVPALAGMDASDHPYANMYLFWTEELTEEETAFLAGNGFEAELILQGGYIGNWVDIYALK